MRESEAELFHRFYSVPGAAVPDSRIARSRLKAAYESIVHFSGVEKQLTMELGVEFNQENYQSFGHFIDSAPIELILSAVTVIYRWSGGYDIGRSIKWRNYLQGIIAQESLGYTVNDECVVRLKVDQAFERVHASVLECLRAPKHKAVRHETEQAYKFLLQMPPNSKEAVRAIFEALETLTKNLLGNDNLPRLTKKFLMSKLVPRVSEQYREDVVAQEVAVDLGKAFAEWVDSLHMYRHGQETIEPVEVPFAVAVMIVDQGAAYIRWLVELDKPAKLA